MRINGTDNFLSEIRKSPLTQQNPLPIHIAQQNKNQDTVDISDAGKKLRLNMRKKTEQANPLPEWAQTVDRALSQTVNIFERMKELATLAQDKKLTDIERVDMQIEIEGLRANLMAMPRNLMTGESLTRLSPEQSNPLLSMSLQAMEKGYYDYGDYSSVLGRMKTRIMNGEEWNVREAWAPRGFTRVTYDENGEEVLEAVAGEAWHVVGDENILTRIEGGKYVDSGINVSTVREKLERLSPVVVMDAESVAKGVQYLEKQIASVQKLRENFATNFTELSKDDVSASLSQIIFPGEIVNAELLIDPTFAGAFLFSGGIYDTPHATRTLEEGNGSDILLTDEENIKDDSWVNNYEGVRVSISNLSKEPITGNVPIKEFEEPKIIEIKGISFKK